MPKFPKNPFVLVKIRWLDACQHNNADDNNEGVVRDTIGYLIRDSGSIVRLANTVDFASDTHSWVPSSQNDIVDIPKGMILGRRSYK